MKKSSLWAILGLFLMLDANPTWSQKTIEFNKYHNYQEMQNMLKALVAEHPGLASLHTIAQSPGGYDVAVLQIGPGGGHMPAIVLGANFEGITPLATEGALFLANTLLKGSGHKNTTWYIIPMPNPDASENFFSSVKYEKTSNSLKLNNDVDELTDEDGFEDLNGDGLITKMRVRDATGNYMVSAKDPRLMVLAKPEKGERGAYKIYTEGIDNDHDGEYNEDGPGGINVGLNFPHLFDTYLKESGLWAGYTPETYGIMEFIYTHPEIGMAFTLGTSNFCLTPPKGGRKGDSNLDAIKIPAGYANMLGAAPNKTYTMEETIKMVKAVMPPETEVDASMVAGMFRLGAVLNPLEDDLVFYKKYAGEYKEFLKKKGFSTEIIDPEPAKDGSFELWAYYHLGVPSFSMNLFGIPKPQKNDTTDKTGSLEEKDQALLDYIDKQNQGQGYINWTSYEHPTLGQVEIGGYAPFLGTTPPASEIDSLCAAQIPWFLALSEKMPAIHFLEEKTTDMGAGIYKLEISIENRGEFAYPIAMGARNSEPAPVAIILDGEFDILKGKKRTPLGTIKGNQVKKLTWLIKAENKSKISATIQSKGQGNEIIQLTIGA